jgi:pyruvate ferredoxin oxidoreductase beta subunit/2-oxoisovalerate ferredoxin oxidoreductase beta subunit
VLAAMGPDTIAVIPPSCMAIIAGPQPYSALRIPVYQPTLESSAAAAGPSTSASSACPLPPSATRTCCTCASTTRAT